MNLVKFDMGGPYQHSHCGNRTAVNRLNLKVLQGLDWFILILCDHGFS